MFFGPSAFQLRRNKTKKRPQTDPKSRQKLVRTLMQFVINLEPTWIDFGRVLAAKLEPSWHQMAPKPHPTTNQKSDHFLEGLRSDLEGVFGPNMAPKRHNFYL